MEPQCRLQSYLLLYQKSSSKLWSPRVLDAGSYYVYKIGTVDQQFRNFKLDLFLSNIGTFLHVRIQKILYAECLLWFACPASEILFFLCAGEDAEKKTT